MDDADLLVVETNRRRSSTAVAIRCFNPDVVVMASHGRSGIARGIHRSVTEHVARRSPKPLLVVPAPAA